MNDSDIDDDENDSDIDDDENASMEKIEMHLRGIKLSLEELHRIRNAIEGHRDKNAARLDSIQTALGWIWLVLLGLLIWAIWWA